MIPILLHQHCEDLLEIVELSIVLLVVVDSSKFLFYQCNSF